MPNYTVLYHTVLYRTMGGPRGVRGAPERRQLASGRGRPEELGDKTGGWGGLGPLLLLILVFKLLGMLLLILVLCYY